ncbi:protein of unknown function [Bradyrhizobium vignae]|uniref:Uncharacterized protein n=1 Tax=Bradyrhizobium vignae TaxID=1549949 RepID=A0A2U3PUF7_9BRAD|nr:protein of unknown function [Bradyrhizobium vignae]
MFVDTFVQPATIAETTPLAAQFLFGKHWAPPSLD